MKKIWEAWVYIYGILCVLIVTGVIVGLAIFGGKVSIEINFNVIKDLF